MSEKQKVKRTLEGIVVSGAMDKTIVVLVVRKVKDAVTGKYIKRSTKIHAHDENNLCKEQDLVVITEGRPVSRTKRWFLTKIISKSE